MNHLKIAALAAVFLTSVVTLPASSSAGFVDFGKFTPSKSGEFVEINIGKTLFSMVAKMVPSSEAEAAEVLRGLERLRVNVIGLDDTNREEVQKRVEAIRGQLDKDGWELIVTVKEKAEDVAIYLKTRGEEAIEGIVVTVLDGKNNAVLINIVGNLQPEKLAMIAEKLNIKPLEKVAKAIKKK